MSERKKGKIQKTFIFRVKFVKANINEKKIKTIHNRGVKDEIETEQRNLFLRSKRFLKFSANVVKPLEDNSKHGQQIAGNFSFRRP